MEHAFSRTEKLIGKDALNILARSRVAVFGVGGVGSYVVEGLVRAGVGKLVLVDSDCVTISNINRQIPATMKTVGMSKVEVMQKRILEINPNVQTVIYNEFYNADTAEKLIHSDYDYIVDAIDTVSSKIDLVVRASERGIPVISSMGAGNKLDPTRFRVADVYSTSICPLAKVMRRELRKRGIKSLKVVYSDEEPIKPKETLENCTESAGIKPPDDNLTVPGGYTKRQVPASISFVPSVAGLIIAGEVVKDLIKHIRRE